MVRGQVRTSSPFNWLKRSGWGVAVNLRRGLAHGLHECSQHNRPQGRHIMVLLWPHLELFRITALSVVVIVTFKWIQALNPVTFHGDTLNM